jgi:hypothetical protein
MASRLISLEQFEPVTGRYRQILEAWDSVKQPQLPLHITPEIAGDSASSPRVPLTEDVSGGLVSKGLDHSAYYILLV